jgi:hypothetical protein
VFNDMFYDNESSVFVKSVKMFKVAKLLLDFEDGLDSTRLDSVIYWRLIVRSVGQLNRCWPSPAQPFSGPSPAGLSIFSDSRFHPQTWRVITVISLSSK